MEGLREMLLKEQIRLERICRQAAERLKDVPLGKLRLSSSHHSVQYYHCVPGEKKKGRYMSRTEQELARKLAQKSYDEKVLKLAQKRLSQIKRITRDYEDREIEKVFRNEHKERKKLISPIEPTWEQRLEAWMAQIYPQKEFQEDIPVILSERGERVRSKSEKILEHDGRMDDPIYARNAVRKIAAYEENDIFPGERLILTFETEKTMLNTRLIEKLVHKYL